MVIPYQTAKFKSANTVAIAILGSTAKFNSCQYFQLYGNFNYVNYASQAQLHKFVPLKFIAPCYTAYNIKRYNQHTQIKIA